MNCLWVCLTARNRFSFAGNVKELRWKCLSIAKEYHISHLIAFPRHTRRNISRYATEISERSETKTITIGLPYGKKSFQLRWKC